MYVGLSLVDEEPPRVVRTNACRPTPAGELGFIVRA
jgi:hypothetical protein